MTQTQLQKHHHELHAIFCRTKAEKRMSRTLDSLSGIYQTTRLFLQGRWIGGTF